MSKVYLLAPHEEWILDRMVSEFTTHNPDICVSSPEDADVIWLVSDFSWDHMPYELLSRKRVITSIHHIVPEKFGNAQRKEFDRRDKITTVYHVPNVHTEAFVKQFTDKPIHRINYWANQFVWHRSGTREGLRKGFGLPTEGYLLGSFQRDSEGAGISQGIYLPKLEKGADLFADYVEDVWKKEKDLHVVLAGWRRQYVIERLKKVGIPYTYFELPPLHVVNDLYQTLNSYVVSSRYEGGPQALIECGLTGTPCISRDIGVASEVLPWTAVNNELMNARPAIPNVENLKLPAGYEAYRKLIEET